MGWLDLQYRHRFIIAILLLVAALLPHGNAHAFSFSIPTNQIASVAESTGAFFCNNAGFLFSLFGLCEDAPDQQSVGPDAPSTPEPKSELDDEKATPPPPTAAPQPATSTPDSNTTNEAPTYVTNEYVTNPVTIIRETIKRDGGVGSSDIDTSSFVIRSLFDAQVNATHNSFSDSVSGLSDNISEELSTDLLTVAGNGTVSGMLNVTGALTTTAYLSASDATATSTLRGALTVGTSTSHAALTLDGALYLASIAPTQTTSRLYNRNGSLYWADNIVAGASVGTWDASGGNVYRATGNVGIGTNNPSTKLDVVGTASSSDLFIDNAVQFAALTNGLLQVDGAGNVSASSTLSNAFIEDAYLLNTGDTATGDYNFSSGTLFVDGSTGRVGIGTATPSDTLHVGSSARFDNVKIDSSTIGTVDTSQNLILTHNNTSIDITSADIYVKQQGGGRLGNTGDIYLQGAGGTGSGKGSDINISSGDSGNGQPGNINLTGGSTNGNNNINQPQNGGDIFIIGGTNINSKVGTGSRDGGAIFVRPGPNTADNTLNGHIDLQYYTGSAYSSALYVKGSDGNIGIGTTTPSSKLTVEGTVGFAGLTGSTGAGSLCLTSNNEVVFNSGSDACLPSLRETKHDIATLDVNALDMVSALESVSFKYNMGDGRTRYGFIAEDVADIDALLATYDAKGAISGIDDRSIIAVVVNAMQEMYQSVLEIRDTLASVLERLSGHDVEIDRLEARIAALEEEAGVASSNNVTTSLSGDAHGEDEIDAAAGDNVVPTGTDNTVSPTDSDEGSDVASSTNDTSVSTTGKITADDTGTASSSDRADTNEEALETENSDASGADDEQSVESDATANDGNAANDNSITAGAANEESTDATEAEDPTETEKSTNTLSDAA